MQVVSVLCGEFTWFGNIDKNTKFVFIENLYLLL